MGIDTTASNAIPMGFVYCHKELFASSIARASTKRELLSTVMPCKQLNLSIFLQLTSIGSNVTIIHMYRIA
jgi:hypothetical protein